MAMLAIACAEAVAVRPRRPAQSQTRRRANVAVLRL